MTSLKTITVFFTFILCGNINAQTNNDTAKMFKAFQRQTDIWKDEYNSGNAQNLVPLYTRNLLVLKKINGN